MFFTFVPFNVVYLIRLVYLNKPIRMRRANVLGALITRPSAAMAPTLAAVAAARCVGGNQTAPAPRVTAASFGPKIFGDGVCFSGTRPLRTQAVCGRADGRFELHMGDIGAKLGQEKRFDRSKPIVFYDTAIRLDTREWLTRYLDGADLEDPVRLVLTGMGGMGKSHNLARWALEQRVAGHLVVYVNDMENWLDAGDEYIFREIEFALYRWRGWKQGVDGFVGFKSTSELLAHLNEASTASCCIPPALGAEADSLLKLVNDVFSKSATSHIGVLGASKLWSDGAGVALSACANVASLVGKKCIFVVDQDNRLNRRFKDLVPNLSHDPKTYNINEVIATNNAHMTVASASANNEGWNRRGWADTLVQKSHGLDPDDADHMIEAALGPAKLYSAEVSKRIQEETGCCPLDIRLICEKMRSLPSTMTPEEAAALGIKDWASDLLLDFKTYVHPLSTDRQKSVALSVISDVEEVKGVGDLRLMEFRKPLAPRVNAFVYRNPHVNRVIRSWAKMKVRPENLGDNEAAKYEHLCICALPFLLKGKNHNAAPVQQLTTAFPHRRDLANVKSFAIFECVPHSMYVDAISVDYIFDSHKESWTCFVGLYQATINTHSHGDSYSGLLGSAELKAFLEDINILNPQCTIDMRFFWMVRMQQATTLQIRESTLYLENAVKDNDPPTKWNFMHDGEFLLNSVASRDPPIKETSIKETSGGGCVIDGTPIREYVFLYNAVVYPKPKFL